MAQAQAALRIGLSFVLMAVLAPVRQARAQTPPPASAAEAVSSPAPRPALILAVAVDEVGISSADLMRTRELTFALLTTLPPGSVIVLASFGAEQRLLTPPTSDRDVLGTAFATLKPMDAGAALPDGLFDIVDSIGRLEADRRAVLLVSAGRLREGDLKFEDPLNAATTRGIPIVALGLGQGDGKLLRRIARITRGEYLRLEVADAPMLAHVLAPDPSSADADPALVAARRGAEPTPTPARFAGRFSGGLLGAAALFFAFGGLLMLGAVILVIRRLTKPAAPALPVAPLKSPESDDDASTVLIDDPAVETTMVVNANPTLRALSGPGAGKNFPVSPSGQTSIGRSRRNDIVVPEDAASAQHCRIDREGDSYVLHDLGATNGTWVNGKRTERAVLQHGDRLKVGETLFAVSLFGDRT